MSAKRSSGPGPALGGFSGTLPTGFEENRNSNDLVMLVGARFVTAAETREGSRLNEQRIKSLTGGDPITAKWLYHDPFTFAPTHKIWLAFNHKPIIADDSEGMWRRVWLVPFNKQFQKEEQDQNLLDKLKVEAPGILAWIVRGCLQWQCEGLRMPRAVMDATIAYRVESDHIEQFLSDRCVMEPSASVASGDLWTDYQLWVEDNAEVRLPRKTFGERLRRRNITQGRAGHAGTRIWVGIGLRPSEKDASPTDTCNTADALTVADTKLENIPGGTST